MPTFRPAGASDSDSFSDDDDLFMSSSHGSKTRSGGAGYRSNLVSSWEAVPVRPSETARFAAMKGDLETIHKLLEDNQLKVDEPLGDHKWSMLMFASYAAKPILMKFLLEKGADPNFKGAAGYTSVLALASGNDKHEEEVLSSCVSILLEAGVDFTVKEKNELTALHLAAKSNNLYLAAKFIEMGIDKNATDVTGRTVLHHAAFMGMGRMVRLLVQAGCDVSLVDEEGQKAYEIAAEKDFHTISDVLYKVETTQWAPGKDPELLNIIREIKPATYRQKEIDKFVVPQRHQIEMILGQLNLSELMPLFEQHDINYFTFLRLTDAHLREMGVSEIGYRLRILDSIRTAHNQDWEKSSIPSVFLQASITMPETACILSNVKDHLLYMSTSIKYLQSRVRDEPDMLKIGAECTKVEELCRQIEMATTAADELKSEALVLKKLFVQLDGRTELQCGDELRVTARSKSGLYITCACCLLGIIYVSVKSSYNFKLGLPNPTPSP